VGKRRDRDVKIGSRVIMITAGRPTLISRPLIIMIIIIHRSRGATTSSKLGVQFLGLILVYWSKVLLPFYTFKIDRSTQFGASGYIITLFIKKLPENLGGPSKFGGSGPPTSQWLRPCIGLINQSLFISGMSERRPAMHN